MAFYGIVGLACDRSSATQQISDAFVFYAARSGGLSEAFAELAEDDHP